MSCCRNLYSFRIITVLTNRNRISICCAGSLLLLLYYVIMCSLWNVNCIGITTFFTCVGPDSFFRTGCLSCNYTTIPVMIKFLSYFSRRKFYSTVFAIDVSGITLFFAGWFFCISGFFVLMTGCY